MAEEADEARQRGESSEEGREAVSDSGDDASPEDISKAKEMGWVPRDQWRGNPDNWTDAKEFVRRGETFVPFLQKDRRRLSEELAARDASLAELQRQNQEMQTQLREISEFNQEMAKERRSRRKSELSSEIAQAREAGNEARISELRAELDEITTAERKQAREPEERAQDRQQPTLKIAPWVQNWLSENQEFMKTPHYVDVFNGIVARKRAAGDRRVGDQEGVAFLNEARQEVEKVFGVRNERRREDSRTEESRQSGGGASGGSTRVGKSYMDLPKDARDKCDAQESRFVGKSKVFKDQAAWRKHFVSEYFSQ